MGVLGLVVAEGIFEIFFVWNMNVFSRSDFYLDWLNDEEGDELRIID